MEFEMPRDCNGTELRVGDVLHLPGDNDSRVEVNGFAVVPTYYASDFDRNATMFRHNMWEVVERGEDAKAEMRAAKRLEKLMAQLGAESYGEARTAINELKQHQVTENARRLKERAEFLSHKLDEAHAETERLRRERDQAFIERDAAEETCDRLRSEVERLKADRDEVTEWYIELNEKTDKIVELLCDIDPEDCDNGKDCADCAVENISELKARQLLEGVEWPVDAKGVRIEVGDTMKSYSSVREFTIDRLDVCVHVVGDRGGFHILDTTGWHHVQPEPTETQGSRERLEEDSSKARCSYWGKIDASCRDCEHKGEIHCGIPRDIVLRAKALAGVE